MDLSDISRKRALADLGIARSRILDLSQRVGQAAQELQQLRAELGSLRASKAANEPAPAQRAEIGSGGGAAIGGASHGMPSNGLFARLWKPKSKKSPILWHVDDLCGRPASLVSGLIKTVEPWREGGLLTISGWIVPTEGAEAFGGARLVLRGGSAISRQGPTFLREDVAAHFGNPHFSSCGFRFVVPMAELGAGIYALDLVGIAPGGREVSVYLGEIALG